MPVLKKAAAFQFKYCLLLQKPYSLSKINSTYREVAFNLNHSCELNIEKLITWIHLGCGSEEKHHAQAVEINIKLIFATPPLATQTDNIDDTICYAETVRLIQKLCQEHRFNLIEHLAARIYDIIYHDLIKTKSEKVF